jgi:hypothetical protein
MSRSIVLSALGAILYLVSERLRRDGSGKALLSHGGNFAHQ